VLFSVLAVIVMVLSVAVPVALLKLFIDSSRGETNRPQTSSVEQKSQLFAWSELLYAHDDGEEDGFCHGLFCTCLSCSATSYSSSTAMDIDWSSTDNWMTDPSYSYMEGNIFHSDD